MSQGLQPAAAAPHYTAHLRQHLPLQTSTVARYTLGDEQIWIKKAGPPHSMWRYRAMGLLASLLGQTVLRPVPHPGGTKAIATEVRRLQQLTALGLRVPQVVAADTQGFAMRHLGVPGYEALSLDTEIWQAAQQGRASKALHLWLEGLTALHTVHAAGTCLSQAFARNLIRCADGAVAYIDFEDDPSAVLPMAHCQVRDVLCYVHSTALHLVTAGAFAQARQHWPQWIATCPADMQQVLQATTARMGWLRHLPDNRRLGRDIHRVRGAYALLAG